MENTKIEWTDHTFNPWIGCTQISPACYNCYAQVQMGQRFGKVKWGAGEPRVRTSPANWKKPLSWNRKALASGKRPFVFCASLADVFDNEIDPSWRSDLFDLIERTPQLVWLLLTKRIGNVEKMVESLPRNVALGATMANQAEYDRDARKLRTASLKFKPLFTFGSFEPLLGPIELDHTTAPDWVIVGGESGRGARPMDLDWARSLREQCCEMGLIFNFKQEGAQVGHGSDMLDGKYHFDRPQSGGSRAVARQDSVAYPEISQLMTPAFTCESQFYRLDDHGAGKPRYFAVSPMVEFATKNLDVEFVRADRERAAGMLKDGVVNAEYVLSLTREERLAPIIIGIGAGKNGGDLIIDGNHRYVAWTLALHERGREMVIPAYRLQCRQWEDFIVPDELVPQMGMFDPNGVKPGARL